ncbi:TonB-dependent receptor [Gracilimonas sp. BCB1]|uniref:TonB-dependent receptor n=1 Tax=Gracilimonas sp. BCB1 TaxID=3152362 RepID=UPI0032D9436A
MTLFRKCIKHRYQYVAFAFLTLLIVLTIIPAAYAQQTSLLRVVVLSEEDGNPLVGSNVVLYLPGGERLLYNCVTNSDGFCEIRNIDANREYELRISYIGFAAHWQKLNFEKGERKTLRIDLEPEVGEINEFTVQGNREITTGEVGIRRIGNEDVARIPTPGVDGDLVSYIQTVPGVVSTGDRGGDLYIRGGTPEQNKILVDNLPVIKPFHISNMFSAFSEEVVQNAEMYAGGFGAEYSGATSSVIDINLRPGNMRNFSGSGAVSPYLVSLQLEGPVKTDRQSILFTARTSAIEEVAPSLIGKEVPIQFSDIIGRYTIQEDNISCNITGILTEDSGEVVPDRQVVHSWTNSVLGARCLGYDPRFEYPIEISVGYTGFENKEGTTATTERYSAIRQFYVNTNLKEKPFGIPVNYGFGVNLRTYDIKLDEQFTNYTSLDRVVPVINVFLSVPWKPNNKWAFQPGLTSQISLDTPVSFEPRLRMSWQPDGTNRQQLSFAAGRYVQFMSGVSDQRDIGTVFTVLQPINSGDPLPSSLHGIVGYQQKIGNAFIANVEGYVKDHKNIPVSKWEPEARLQIETALADGFSYGFDVRFRYSNYPFFVSSGYGWSVVEYEAVSGDLGAWIEEPVFKYYPAHDQRHKLNTVIGYQFAGFEANMRWELGSGKPYTRVFGFDLSVRVPAEDVVDDPGQVRTLYSRPFGERLPYYHRLDVSLNRKFSISGGWSLSAETGVINAYNRNNVFNYDLNTLQRVNQTPLFPYLSVKLSKN